MSSRGCSKSSQSQGLGVVRGTMVTKVLGTRDAGDEATKGNYGERWGEGHEGDAMYLIDTHCTLEKYTSERLEHYGNLCYSRLMRNEAKQDIKLGRTRKEND